MANYLTTDSELTAVADAIRAKGNTDAPLVYPTGFVSAIENIPECRMAGGLVTPSADAPQLVIPEPYQGAQAVVVAAGEAAAKARGTNTIYGAKGLIGTGTEFASAVNLLYFYVNASNALGMAGTSADPDAGGIRIGVSATRFFRAGLTYQYKVYYWDDENM